MNNSLKHISDESKYKTFDPTGTAFPATVKDVQTALAQIDKHAIKTVGLPVASKTVSGIIRISTDAEADGGINDTTAITPKQVEKRLRFPHATTSIYGTTRYATDTEVLNVAIDNLSVTPKTLDTAINKRISSEAKYGMIRIATEAQAVSGTDDTNAITSKKLKKAIASFVTGYDIATENVTGLVKLATLAQIREGKLKDGYAIAPSSFNLLTSNETQSGVVKISTNALVTAGVDDTTAISPKKLKIRLDTMKGTTSQLGFVKISNTVGTGDVNTVLGVNSNVLTNDVKVNNKQFTNKSITITSSDVNTYDKNESDDRYLKKSDYTPPPPAGGGCLYRDIYSAFRGNNMVDYYNYKDYTLKVPRGNYEYITVVFTANDINANSRYPEYDREDFTILCNDVVIGTVSNYNKTTARTYERQNDQGSSGHYNSYRTGHLKMAKFNKDYKIKEGDVITVKCYCKGGVGGEGNGSSYAIDMLLVLSN